MKGLRTIFEQWTSVVGAGIAAACCLGVPVILSTLTTLGLGVIINDAYLLPLFSGFIAISIRILYNSSKQHGSLAPFWFGLLGGLIGTVSLWLLVTGVYAFPTLIYIGLGMLVLASIWDFMNSSSQIRDTDIVCEKPLLKISTGKQIGRGVSISIAAAGIFYGMYKSVEKSNVTSKDDVACWGANSCKGRTACSTAYNSCTAMNSCKGKGFVYLPKNECDKRGGQPLKGSEGDPENAS